MDSEVVDSSSGSSAEQQLIHEEADFADLGKHSCSLSCCRHQLAIEVAQLAKCPVKQNIGPCPQLYWMLLVQSVTDRLHRQVTNEATTNAKRRTSTDWSNSGWRTCACVALPQLRRLP